jgi:hypothetical protein
MIDAQPTPERYAPVILSNVHKAPEWNALDADLRDAIEVVARVLPFRTNRYVMEELIDWSKVPNAGCWRTNTTSGSSPCSRTRIPKV